MNNNPSWQPTTSREAAGFPASTTAEFPATGLPAAEIPEDRVPHPLTLLESSSPEKMDLVYMKSEWVLDIDIDDKASEKPEKKRRNKFVCLPRKVMAEL